MEKNVILAVVLSLLVLLGYNAFITKYIDGPAAPKGDLSNIKNLDEQDQKIEAPARSEESAHETAAKPSILLTSVAEKEIVIETPLFRGIITNYGGGIKAWELKSYRETMEKDSPPIDVFSFNTLERYSYEVSILDASSGDEERLVLSPSKESLILGKDDTAQLVLSGVTSKGLTVTERLNFSGDSYAVDTTIEVLNNSSQPFNGIISLNMIGSAKEAKKSSRLYGHIGPVTYINEGIERDDAQKIIEEEKNYEGNILWTSMEEKYFITSMLPSASTDVKLRIASPYKGFVSSNFLVQKPLAPQQASSHSFTLYIGPKEMDTLKNMEKHLEEVIDFGYFSFIAKPLLIALNFFYYFLSNYALAIILLTALIKLIFYPLTKTSLKSMKEMQKIQPQMAAIRKKHKDNKEKMNKEIMELYKRNKVNPLGGCLPMILQIPVFIALYNVLLTSIELRHAPFIFWITDLSQPDRLGSLPIPFVSPPGIPVLTLLMGASMFLQQKMSPTAMDPQQAKIMMLMPVFFTFMFLNFPAGLVLYWLINNMLQIGQQYYIQKKA